MEFNTFQGRSSHTAAVFRACTEERGYQDIIANIALKEAEAIRQANRDHDMNPPARENVIQ